MAIAEELKGNFLGLTPDVINFINHSVHQRFGNHLLYSFSSGSYAYGGGIKGKSDIDIIAILDDSVRQLPKLDLMQRIEGFVDDYLVLHKEQDLIPDTVFPGEYLTYSMVQDAVAGRGLHVNDNNVLFLPSTYEGYYLEDPERWYRAWLSQSTFSVFVGGNGDMFLENKRKAWETSILFLLAYLPESEIDSQTIIQTLTSGSNKRLGLGVTDRYLTFTEREAGFVSDTLQNLTEKGYLAVTNKGFQKNVDQIQNWHWQKDKRIKDGTIRKAPFLLDLEEIKQLAVATEEKWQQLLYE